MRPGGTRACRTVWEGGRREWRVAAPRLVESAPAAAPYAHERAGADVQGGGRGLPISSRSRSGPCQEGCGAGPGRRQHHAHAQHPWHPQHPRQVGAWVDFNASGQARVFSCVGPLHALILWVLPASYAHRVGAACVVLGGLCSTSTLKGGARVRSVIFLTCDAWHST